MQRAIKITLAYATGKKRLALSALILRYRHAVNFFIRSLWTDRGGLDANTLRRLDNTELSARYKSQALKQAFEIVIATKRSAKETGKPASCPVFQGDAILDAKFVSVEGGHGSFDLIVRISSLVPGQRITIPTRRTVVLNRWLSVPGAKMVQGCGLSEDRLVLWVDVPNLQSKTEGRTMGIDIGMNKMVSDSDGNHHGTRFKRVLVKIRRRLPGSKGRQRAFSERDNYIGCVLNRLPWTEIAVLGVETLSDMKRGKKRNRGKSFRKAIAPWVYRRVLERIGHKAQENRVLLVANPAAYSSTTCPKCGGCDKLNRHGEDFACVGCNYTSDADTVGARNILARTLATVRSVESLALKRAM